MSAKNQKVVFFPLEIASRELDYKTILAALIAQPDVYCFVGQHNLLNKLLKSVRGGVYFGKNIFPERFPCSMTHYNLLKKQGHSLAFYHEEGGVLAGSEKDWKIELSRQIDPAYLSNDDAILCWGEYQYNFYNSVSPDHKPFIHNVGCPRFDLGKGSEISELLNEISRVDESGYILFNTNFAAMNHHIDNLTWFNNTLKKDNSLQHTLNTISIYGQTMQVLGNFLEMIALVVAEFPNKKFFLRPHPSENLSFYNGILSSFKNLEIVRDYTAIEWIHRCDLLIQNGCTTSLEAYFMNKKIISFYPFENKSNVNITRGIGIGTQQASEVIEVIKNLNKYPIQNSDLKGISKLIANFESTQSSFQKICQIINNMLDSKKGESFSMLQIKAQALIHTALIRIKELGKFISPTKKKNIKYFNSNFPGFNNQQLEEKVAVIENILNKDLELTYVNKDLFIITEQTNKKSNK